MEKRNILLFMCFACFLIQGCVSVSKYKIAPELLTGQKHIDNDANAIVSHKKTSVFVRPMAETYTSEDNPVIMLGLFSEKEIDLSPENIQAFIDGKPYHILTHDEMLDDIKQRYESAIRAVREQYNTRSQQVADASKKSANDPAVFEPNPGRREAVGNSDRSGYKIDANALGQGMTNADNQMKLDIAAIEKKTKEEVETLNATMLLRKTTIEPDTWYRGQIKMAKIPDADRSHEIKLAITASGEEHHFVIKTSAIK